MSRLTTELGYDTTGRVSSETELIEGLDELGAPVVVSARDERFDYDGASRSAG